MGAVDKGLFRPGRGSVIVSYTAAVADGAMYPADWVELSTTAPASQGVSGVYAGETLGDFDYIEMRLADADNLGCGSLTLGVLMGKGIHAVADWETVTAGVLADGDVGIIQTRGVHPQTRQVATGLLGDYLTISTTAGEMLNGVSAAVTGILNPAGVCLANTSTYTRVTAADEDGGVSLISRIY